MTRVVTKFIYVTYIAASREKVWEAITDADVSRRYWAQSNVSTWRPGALWEHVRPDGAAVIAGQVIESDRPNRLVLTWAFPTDVPDEAQASIVAFDLETVGTMTRLTVTHDELEEGSDMIRRISQGWPRVLSSLKSFLETGTPLDTWADSEPRRPASK
jgi:uncharacterized protein YndB with AHSA1/START domain